MPSMRVFVPLYRTSWRQVIRLPSLSANPPDQAFTSMSIKSPKDPVRMIV